MREIIKLPNMLNSKLIKMFETDIWIYNCYDSFVTQFKRSSISIIRFLLRSMTFMGVVAASDFLILSGLYDGYYITGDFTGITNSCPIVF